MLISLEFLVHSRKISHVCNPGKLVSCTLPAKQVCHIAPQKVITHSFFIPYGWKAPRSSLVRLDVNQFQYLDPETVSN